MSRLPLPLYCLLLALIVATSLVVAWFVLATWVFVPEPMSKR